MEARTRNILTAIVVVLLVAAIVFMVSRGGAAVAAVAGNGTGTGTGNGGNGVTLSACPPPGFGAGSYWGDLATDAGLDSTRTTNCANQWYYDGQPTCLGGGPAPGAYNVACPPGLICAEDVRQSMPVPAPSQWGSPGLQGFGSGQMAALKYVVDGGGVAPGCPAI